MDLENENLVLDEDTENVEETTEETKAVEEIEKPTEPEKKYTDDDLNSILAKKIARKEARIRKDYEKKYSNLENVLKAGTGEEDLEAITNTFTDFYTKKGIKIPTQPTYNESDMKALARNDAQTIIDAGYDEVVEEVDRLAGIGVENMTPREKLVFTQLAEFRKAEGNKKELASIGVKEEVLNSQEFKDFTNQFNSNTPITKVYELYTKTLNKPQLEKIGSMKNGNTQEEKTYYTPDEVDKLTSKELDDPSIFQRVRESMAKW